ncbi:11608_t:CDS:2, partial [Racocetra fulgida]
IFYDKVATELLIPETQQGSKKSIEKALGSYSEAERKKWKFEKDGEGMNLTQIQESIAGAWTEKIIRYAEKIPLISAIFRDINVENFFALRKQLRKLKQNRDSIME